MYVGGDAVEFDEVSYFFGVFMTSVLITGIAGFVGSALARELIQHGYEVHGVDILPPTSARRLFDIKDLLDIS